MVVNSAKAWLLLLCSLTVAAPCHAQNAIPPETKQVQRLSEYEQFAPDLDVDSALRQLNGMKLLPDQKKILKNIARAHGLDSQDPRFEEWLKNLQNNPKLLDNVLKSFKGRIDQPKFNFEPLPESEDPEDRLAQWLKSLVENVENTNLGDELRDSPAWRQGVEDLQKWMEGGRFGVDGKLPDRWWNGKVTLPDWKWGADRLKGINFTPPRLPAIRIPMPRMPNLGLPRFRVPSLGNFSTPDSFQAIGWIALVLAASVLVVVGLRHGKAAAAAAKKAATLGPWPVAPDQVSTRSELISAFDYLALLTLGEDARSFNHHRVADRLGELSPAQLSAAQRLAALYEVARYTVGEETLGEAERTTVRADLRLLAGLAG